ncbi:MAG TPA: hypothetical protein VFD23_00295 [Clostridia bacterium]|nr:hypothetical protein [Clostridia bacterium]
MSEISALPADIVGWLGTQDPLADIQFITEFPPQAKAVPLEKVTVAAGIEHVKIRDSFTANDEGVLIENEYCRLAAIKIKLAIHVPFSLGGAKCHDVFTDIIDCLTFASDLNIVESGCGFIRADRNTDALVLDCLVVVTADFCPAVSSSVRFRSFLNKDLLCGSHITNNAIHVTPADKALWDAPFAVGTYFGNGAANQTVVVGFAPKIAAVFAAQYPANTVDFINSGSLAYWGFAVGGSGTQGIELTNTGFKLLPGSSQGVCGSRPRLNETGLTYFYIAVK